MFKEFDYTDPRLSFRHRKTEIKLSDIVYPLFDASLIRTSSPEIYVVPSEPGSGKSTTIQTYIKELSAGKRAVINSGAIVFLHTKREIEAYIKACGLTNGQYAVVVAGDPVKNVGLYGGLLRHDEAPILFTTTAMLRSLSRSSFADVTKFYYKGKPRLLRLWDEEFYLASTITINLDDLAALKAPLRPKFLTLIAEIERIELEAKGVKFSEIRVSGFRREIADAALDGHHGLTEAQRTTLADFRDMVGKTVRLIEGSWGAYALVGERRRLPDDIAPLFVFDASERVSEGYRIMEDAGVPILRLPATRISYTRLQVIHMVTAAGKTALHGEAKRTKLIANAGEVINASSDKEWLVLAPKDLAPVIMKELKTLCPGKLLDHVHWGNHRASNDYRHIKQVMCFGLQRYSIAGYDEVHVKFGGDFGSREHHIESLRTSELQSLMLQSFTRSNLRNHAGGECGDCKIYVMDSERNLKNMLRVTFPGFRYKEWTEKKAVLAGRKREILDYVLSISSTDLAEGVKKTEIYHRLGIDRTNFAKYLKDHDLRLALAEQGIIILRTTLQLE